MPLPNALGEIFTSFGKNIIDSWFLWTPIICGVVLNRVWCYYIRYKSVIERDCVLLEIKLPRDLYKGPKSMEILLHALHQTSVGDWWDRYFTGKLRAWFSLELYSRGGDIHFYIHTAKFFRNLVEAQIYSQFPDAEVFEAEDYASTHFRNGMGVDWDMAGGEFKMLQPSVFPIKTYIEYGLQETMTKEEQKSDPMTAVLETMGSLKEGEHMWIQILIQALLPSGDKFFSSLFSGRYALKNEDKEWKAEAKKVIDDMIKAKENKSADGMVSMGAFALTPGERSVIEAIEKKIAKIGFRVGIRGLYLARKDRFNKINWVSIIAAMKQYNSLNLNGFKPSLTTASDKWYNMFFKNWQARREFRLKRKILDAYRWRSYFYMPYERKSMIFNTEELATMFHFPGRVAETPTLARIEAKKSEAPINLPV